MKLNLFVLAYIFHLLDELLFAKCPVESEIVNTQLLNFAVLHHLYQSFKFQFIREVSVGLVQLFQFVKIRLQKIIYFKLPDIFIPEFLSNRDKVCV